jgi:hypothetical protein
MTSRATLDIGVLLTRQAGLGRGRRPQQNTAHLNLNAVHSSAELLQLRVQLTVPRPAELERIRTQLMRVPV